MAMSVFLCVCLADSNNGLKQFLNKKSEQNITYFFSQPVCKPCIAVAEIFLGGSRLSFLVIFHFVSVLKPTSVDRNFKMG